MTEILSPVPVALFQILITLLFFYAGVHFLHKKKHHHHTIGYGFLVVGIGFVLKAILTFTSNFDATQWVIADTIDFGGLAIVTWGIVSKK